MDTKHSIKCSILFGLEMWEAIKIHAERLSSEVEAEVELEGEFDGEVDGKLDMVNI